MKRDELIALADRCEKAEGPDVNLDCAIFATVLPERFAGSDDAALYARLNWTRNRGDWVFLRDIGMLAYTASIDAALTLVPEGWRLRQMNFSGPCAEDHKWHLNLHGGAVGEDTFVGRGATPALALCAAALRAHTGEASDA